MVAGPQPPSFNEQFASLELLPLFMSSPPDDSADNMLLSALQSLVRDGTPDGRRTCSPFVLLSRGSGAHTKSHEK